VFDIAQIVFIVSLAVGVVAACLSFWAGNVKEKNFRLDLATANASAARANERAEELRKRNLELEAAIAPRLLEQGKSSAALKPFSGIQVFIVVMPDFEARRLAGQLAIMFDLAAWKLQRPFESDSDLRDGVAVQYASGADLESGRGFEFGESQKAAAEALVAQLAASGIEAKTAWVPTRMAVRGITRNANIPLEAIVVRVGLKPIGYFADKRLGALEEGAEGKVIFGNIG
jgi:hypothetical protein